MLYRSRSGVLHDEGPRSRRGAEENSIREKPMVRVRIASLLVPFPRIQGSSVQQQPNGCVRGTSEDEREEGVSCTDRAAVPWQLVPRPPPSSTPGASAFRVLRTLDGLCLA